MRENPRPTRHLEQLETAQLGKLAPGSVSGPAWDLVALPGPPDDGAPEASEADAVAHRFAPAAPAPAPPPAVPAPAAPVASPPASGTGLRRLTMIAVGCGVLAAFALGIGGLTMLWADRPDAETTGPVERTALDLPLVPADDEHAAGTGESAETRLRSGGDAEAGEPQEDGADVSRQGDAAPSDGRLDQGDTGEGAPGAGASTGGSGGSGGSGGPGSGADPGSGGGGTTTPTDGPPPPTSTPTTDPTEEPTPKPTPTVSDEPTPEPTPSPTVSPTPTPTGAPVSPNAGG